MSYLYIFNFIKFLYHVEPKNCKAELEANKIADWLKEYSNHFYHWLGYNLYIDEENDYRFGLEDWVYRDNYIQSKPHILSLRKDILESMKTNDEPSIYLGLISKIKTWDVDKFMDCFINISDKISPDEEMYLIDHDIRPIK
jgi:hypothetical protein